MAVVSMKKQYPGHAKRVMFGVWSFLRQFMYTKFIVVVDDDIDARDWKEVVWAITTRVDPARDTLIAENTPIDYLDFASPVAGLGSKMGIDATHKWPGETSRTWGRPIAMDAAVKRARGRALEGTEALAFVDPAQQRIHCRLRLLRVGMVHQHHHHDALAAAVEHVAGHRRARPRAARS